MKRYTFTVGLTAAAFALSLTPLWAQDRSRPADSPTTGSAVPRDSGSSSGSSSGSGSSTSSSGSSSSSGSGSSGWTGNSGGYEAPRRAPVNPERVQNGDQRRGGGSTTGRAVPRGEGGSSGSATTSTRSSDGSDRQGQGRNRAVPTYSRPRDGRNPLGTAVERPDGFYRDGRPYSYTTFVYDPSYSYYYDPYYRSRYYWSPWGYGYGFGYMAYDPFLFGGFGYPDYYGAYDDPYYGGGYSGGGYSGGGYSGGGYSGGGYSGGGYYGGGGGGYSSRESQAYRGVGSLRLKVKPGHAQVFVDGYFVGTVDSFDGTFQRLNVEGGSHKIELRADGYEATQFDVMVIPGETITYKGDMRHR